MVAAAAVCVVEVIGSHGSGRQGRKGRRAGGSTRCSGRRQRQGGWCGRRIRCTIAGTRTTKIFKIGTAHGHGTIATHGNDLDKARGLRTGERMKGPTDDFIGIHERTRAAQVGWRGDTGTLTIGLIIKECIEGLDIGGTRG